MCTLRKMVNRPWCSQTQDNWIAKTVLFNLYSQMNQGWINRRLGTTVLIKVLVSRSEPVLKTRTHWLKERNERQGPNENI